MLTIVISLNLQKLWCGEPGCKNKTGFASKDSLASHMRRFHKGNSVRADCPECGKSVLHYMLSEHMKLHTGEADVECEICNFVFANNRNLKKNNNSNVYEHACILKGNSKLSAFYYCKIDWHKTRICRVFVRVGRASRGHQRQANRNAAIRPIALDFFAAHRSPRVRIRSARVAAKRHNQSRFCLVYLEHILRRLDGSSA